MLVRWTPFREMNRLSQELERAFGFAPVENGAAAAWNVPFDVTEDAERLVLTADVPGVAEKDLDISVEKNVLTIKGTRALRPAGAFARSFKLSETVNAEKISASLKDGVLTLVLPKKPEAQPRQIKVSVA